LCVVEAAAHEMEAPRRRTVGLLETIRQIARRNRLMEEARADLER
jgi:hypothetical protein